MWLAVEGKIQDVIDDLGEDGKGGTWAGVTIDYRTDEEKQGYPMRILTMPRLVVMHFLGADANVIRALSAGDYLKANGRIRSIAGIGGGIDLAPAEVVEYGSGATSAT